MSHNFGILTLPATPPDISSLYQSLDPVLNILAASIPTILTAWLADTWGMAAPTDPFIRTVYLFDPNTVYDGALVVVDDSALPALYICTRTIGSTNVTDAGQEVETEISLQWVPQSRQYQDNTLIDAVFNLFAKAIGEIVKRERDPSWVADEDQGDASSDAAKLAAQIYGSNIPDKCGFDRWTQLPKDAVTRVHFTVATIRYDGFLAKITAMETSELDLSAAGFVPTAISVSLNTGGDDPLVTGGFEKAPT